MQQKTGGQVAVLMALFNGAPHLQAQLDSLARQGTDWRLWVGDDGSTDTGPQIVRDFAASQPNDRVELLTGPGQGPAQNFRRLLQRVPDEATAVAFCDQDDVWLDDKLSRATAALRQHDGPAIWCSRATICDAALTPIGITPALRRPPGFRNALVQNIVIGHTLTLNRAALDLVRAADALTGPVVMHDWWIYQLVTGAGGRVIRDETPSTLYRQHQANAVGAPSDGQRQLRAFGRMMGGSQRRWNQVMTQALSQSRALLTPENQMILHDFQQIRQGGPTARLAALRRSGLYRQGRGEQAALWLAAALGRV